MSEVTFHDLVPLPASPGRYHEWPERDEQTIAEAYLECYTSAAGQIVMDEEYRMLCQLVPEHPLRLSLLDLWQARIDTMRRGMMYRRFGPPTSPEE